MFKSIPLTLFLYTTNKNEEYLLQLDAQYVVDAGKIPQFLWKSPSAYMVTKMRMLADDAQIHTKTLVDDTLE